MAAFAINNGVLSRERVKLEAKLKQVNGKLKNEKFLANAPENVINKEKDKKEKLDATLEKIDEEEKRLKSMNS